MTNFCQKITLASVASIAAVTATLAGTDPSLAQSQTTCQSYDLKRVSCQIDTRDGVEIDRQYSQTPCRGKWGFGRGYVWVEDGCRASFKSLGDDNDRSDRERYSRGDDNDRRDGGRYSRGDYKDLDQIYRDVLDREIDRRGYRVYSDRMRDGWSLSRVRREVARSSEATESINRLYQRILGRDADSEGLRTYRKQLEDGWSLRRVERELARSQESRERRRD